MGAIDEGKRETQSLSAAGKMPQEIAPKHTSYNIFSLDFFCDIGLAAEKIARSRPRVER